MRGALFLFLVLASRALAGEPEVAFAVKDGWLRFTVTQDERPVPHAEVRVYDAAGTKFADGDTDAHGTGEFPLPNGPHLVLEFIIEKRTSDPLTLQRPSPEQVTPTRVMLTFGLAPCCRVPSQGKSELDEWEHEQAMLATSRRVWFSIVGAIAFTLLGVVVVLWTRKSPSSQGTV